MKHNPEDLQLLRHIYIHGAALMTVAEFDQLKAAGLIEEGIGRPRITVDGRRCLAEMSKAKMRLR